MDKRMQRPRSTRAHHAKCNEAHGKITLDHCESYCKKMIAKLTLHPTQIQERRFLCGIRGYGYSPKTVHLPKWRLGKQV